MTRTLTKPSIPPAASHQAGHYSGLHPEDQPYQSSKMLAQRPLSSETTLTQYPELEPEHIELPVFEPVTDPELQQPTLLIERPARRSITLRPARLPERSARPRLALPRFSSLLLTILCLLFLLGSSILAFILLGNHTSVATAAFTASPNTVRHGDPFTLNGRGFRASSLLHFSLDARTPLYDGAGKLLVVHTDEHGLFSLPLHVLATWAVGAHTLYASDLSQGLSISTGITIEPPSVAPPKLMISRSELHFAAGAAGTVANLPLTLQNAGGGTLNWQLSSDQAWLSASPTSGAFAGSAGIQVQVNRGSLAPHTYSGHLLITQKGAETITVPVSMEVSPAPANLVLSQTTLAFAASTAQNPGTQTLIIQNSGGQPLNWNSMVTTGDGSPWLSLSPSEGRLDPATSAILTISATSLQLAPRSLYQGSINFTGGANAQVSVSLDVQAPGNLVLSPPSLTMNLLTSQQTGTGTVIVQNSGGQPLTWSASATTASAGKWLSVTPTQGTLAPEDKTTLTVTVTLPLAAGAYQGTINFSSPGQARQLAISATVAAPPLQMQASSLSFTAMKGVNPAAQTLSMTNTGSTTLNWSAAMDNAAPAFLTVSPVSGKIAPGQQVTLAVNADIVNAAVGTLSSSISIVSSNTGVLLADEKVAVNVVISNPAPVIGLAPTSLTLNQATGNTGALQTLTLTSTATTDVHWSLAQPSGSAQTWLVLSSTSGTLDAGGSVQLNVSCTDTALAPGNYTVTLQLFDTDVSTTTPVQTLPITLTVS